MGYDIDQVEGSGYYDKQGKPISLKDASSRGEDYKRIGADTIGDVRVSTVWLGLDFSWGEGAPIIFETMVFDGPLDLEGERYCTEGEAKQGHARWVQRVREVEANPEPTIRDNPTDNEKRLLHLLDQARAEKDVERAKRERWQNAALKAREHLTDDGLGEDEGAAKADEVLLAAIEADEAGGTDGA